MTATAFQIAVFEAAFLSVLILAAAGLVRFRVRWEWLLPIPVLALVTKLIMFELGAGTLGDWIGGRYNWEGKIVVSLIWLGLIFLLFRGRFATVGLTLSQNGRFPKIGVAVAIFTALATAAWSSFYFPGTKSEPLVDMLYQASMPSIEEELWSRGLMLCMLILGFTPKGKDNTGAWAVVLAAAIVSLEFWATHSISTDGDWGFIFRLWYNPVAGIYGVLWVTVRLGTGSLLLPILLHSWANTCGYFL